jgi:hypothetical protein
VTIEDGSFSWQLHDARDVAAVVSEDSETDYGDDMEDRSDSDRNELLTHRQVLSDVRRPDPEADDVAKAVERTDSLTLRNVNFTIAKV